MILQCVERFIQNYYLYNFSIEGYYLYMYFKV